MNARQILAINEGINGHNLLILGQSGTGKSYLINEIKDQLKKRGKSVAITGTTDFQSNRPQVKSAPVKSTPIQIGPKSNRPQNESHIAQKN
jgi:ABC-type transporter Mla maintaining outer membrane lipid asymmetry ATPase subunit MlaF